jgi:hypothetical protein
MASIGNLKEEVSAWQPLGVPITALMITEAQGASPCVPKTIVDLQGPAFAALVEMRKLCAVTDGYENPGPLQFNGPSSLVDSVTTTLTLESFVYMQDIKKFQSALLQIQEACRPGCSATLMHIATRNLETLNEIIGLVNPIELPVGIKRIHSELLHSHVNK